MALNPSENLHFAAICTSCLQDWAHFRPLSEFFGTLPFGCTVADSPAVPIRFSVIDNILKNYFKFRYLKGWCGVF
jgi:hypothetical protein